MLVTGDSFVYGEGTAQESIFPYALREAYDGRYDVVGCGLWGYNTLDSYMLYRERLSQLAPDIVLHVFVLNDAECRLFCTSSRPTADPATDTQATWNRIRRPLNHWLSPNRGCGSSFPRPSIAPLGPRRPSERCCNRSRMTVPAGTRAAAIC